MAATIRVRIADEAVNSSYAISEWKAAGINGRYDDPARYIEVAAWCIPDAICYKTFGNLSKHVISWRDDLGTGFIN